MAIEWNESLSVGVNSIDEQHKEWFKKANELFEAGKQGKAKEHIAQMLEFLDSYTKFHFSDEERYMRSINYPLLDEQIKMHTDFIAQLKKLKEDYENSGGNVLVVLNANQIILNWLTGHIIRHDKKIGEYVRSLDK
ncbi:MAG: hemerythrin family protein [Clostridiaceae bacterium]|nr:hemerythrin family protein [Clostridiaceae bacterium]